MAHIPHRARYPLREIFVKTNGRCHLCFGELVYQSYGRHGELGAWEVDHSNPRCKGGTDRLPNLWPAHTTCNRSKSAGSTRSHRRRNGYSRAPLSKLAQDRVRRNRQWGVAATAYLVARALRADLPLGVAPYVHAALRRAEHADPERPLVSVDNIARVLRDGAKVAARKQQSGLRQLYVPAVDPPSSQG